MIYNCKSCNYSTDNKSRWNRHINSKKHISISNCNNSNLKTITNILDEININSNNTSELYLEKEITKNISEEVVENTSEEVVENTSEEVVEDASEEVVEDASGKIVGNASGEVVGDVSEEVVGGASEEVVDEKMGCDVERNENYVKKLENENNKLKNQINCLNKKYNKIKEDLNKLKNKIPEPEIINNLNLETKLQIKPIFFPEIELENKNKNEIIRIKNSIDKLKELGKYKYYKVNDINLKQNNTQDIELDESDELDIIELDAQNSYHIFDPFLNSNESDDEFNDSDE